MKDPFDGMTPRQARVAVSAGLLFIIGVVLVVTLYGVGHV